MNNLDQRRSQKKILAPSRNSLKVRSIYCRPSVKKNRKRCHINAESVRGNILEILESCRENAAIGTRDQSKLRNQQSED